MYGFLLWKSNSSIDEEKFAYNFIEAHDSINPFSKLGLKYYYSKTKGYNLITFTPKDENSMKLINIYEDEKFWVLFWGQLFIAEKNYANHIVNLLRAGISVENLNGNYSFVLLDKDNKALSIFSDFIGRRKLFYIHDKTMIAISNLDHLLVPFIPEPVKLDFTSLASSLYFDWSLKGLSFLNHIHTSTPDEIVIFEAGMQKKKKVIYSFEKNHSFEKIIDDYYSYLNFFISDKDTIHADLTAGLDTRTVLALLLKGFNKKIITWTLGFEGEDYKVAEKISQHYNLEHRNSESSFSDLHEFITHANYLAFCKNGDTSSLRATNHLEIDLHAAIPKVIGIYGTISTGKNIPGDMKYQNYKEVIL